jgi:hypothetical protein
MSTDLCCSNLRETLGFRSPAIQSRIQAIDSAFMAGSNPSWGPLGHHQSAGASQSSMPSPTVMSSAQPFTPVTASTVDSASLEQGLRYDFSSGPNGYNFGGDMDDNLHSNLDVPDYVFGAIIGTTVPEGADVHYLGQGTVYQPGASRNYPSYPPMTDWDGQYQPPQ